MTIDKPIDIYEYLKNIATFVFYHQKYLIQEFMIKIITQKYMECVKIAKKKI